MKVELENVRKKKVVDRPRFHIEENPEAKTTTVWINNSSHLVMGACKRKAFYYLEHQLESEYEDPSLLYGTAMHKLLEYYYSGKGVEGSLFAAEAEMNSLRGLDKYDPNSKENLIATFQYYTEMYRGEKWSVYKDKDGPFLERFFEFEIYNHDNVKINFFGTIDAVMVNGETGEVCAFDFKTTSQLGDRFIRGVKPASQFTGYYKALNEHFKIPVQAMMVDGIQKKNLIAKTKRGIQPPQFLRLRTTRTPSEIEEWRRGLIFDVTGHLLCRKLKQWPMNTGSCGQYSGCQYMDICSAEPELRKVIINNQGEKNETI